MTTKNFEPNAIMCYFTARLMHIARYSRPLEEIRRERRKKKIENNGTIESHAHVTLIGRSPEKSSAFSVVNNSLKTVRRPGWTADRWYTSSLLTPVDYVDSTRCASPYNLQPAVILSDFDDAGLGSPPGGLRSTLLTRPRVAYAPPQLAPCLTY